MSIFNFSLNQSSCG